MVQVEHIWATLDPVAFKVILGSFTTPEIFFSKTRFPKHTPFYKSQPKFIKVLLAASLSFQTSAEFSPD